MNDSERMIISAWKDGEVEAPWDSQVSSRVAANPDWAAEAGLHQRVKERLAADPEPSWTDRQAEILERLRSRATLPSKVVNVSWTWLSVAAAALFLIAAGGGYWFGQASVGKSGPQLAELKVSVPHQLELKLSGDGQLIMASTLQGTGP